MSLVKLKVKIKSLAEESSIIRKEENKRKKPRLVVESAVNCVEPLHVSFTYTEASKAKIEKWKNRSIQAKNRATNTISSLAQHRKGVLRQESRASQLAYAFLRGKKYSKTEKPELVGNELIAPPNYVLNRAIETAYRFQSKANKIEISKSFMNWLTI